MTGRVMRNEFRGPFKEQSWQQISHREREGEIRMVSECFSLSDDVNADAVN